MNEPPPELKGFHARNMLQAVGIMAIPLAAWGIGYYRQEHLGVKDELQETLQWVFMLGVGAFMLAIVYKALASVPKCPHCSTRMGNTDTIVVGKTRWRVVKCPQCGSTFRVPTF